MTFSRMSVLNLKIIKQVTTFLDQLTSRVLTKLTIVLNVVNIVVTTRVIRLVNLHLLYFTKTANNLETL